MTQRRVSPQAAMDWLCQSAFPLWLEHGVDWAGGCFQEELHPETLRSGTDFRRLRVVARQIYVFAQAHRLGIKQAEDAVELGLAFLRHHARQEDGGYAMRFDRSNTVIDVTRDLYDHAFVLLAYAHTGRREAARATLDYIDAALGHVNGGWHESVPNALPRRQNPHMHLFEAFLASADLLRETLYLDRADAIVDLFLDRMFQADAGGLPEYYDDHFVPHREGGRFVMEPGHHHEWVWLLSEHRRIAASFGRIPRDTRQAANALMATAERYGVNAEGIIALELWSDGSMKQPATRVWPHTERIKALSRQGADAVQIETALGALWRFFDGVPAGLWCERWNNGLVAGDAAPASTLYHITCALLEVQPAAA